MSNRQGREIDIDDHWYDEPSQDLDVAWVRDRAAELGPKFEKLVDRVMAEMRCADEKRDYVQARLIACRDRFVRSKIVSADVRDWLTRIDKRATALADVLEDVPFPEGSAQAEFYVLDGLPGPDDIAHLRETANAAANLINSWRERGAPKRTDRDDLIRQLREEFKICTSKRPAATNNFREVVAHVIQFLEGKRPKEDTLTGIIKRALYTRRSGSKKTA